MKAYRLIELTISDLEGFLEYVRRTSELIKKQAGKNLVQDLYELWQRAVDSNILLVEESAAP
ncbi:MAG TPA: hypothetical protein EYG51_07770 [Pseudomonadales bacterium]|nr:hypothetical protein [Pseudomonadales bacterium]